jgi:hypothetical protein
VNAIAPLLIFGGIAVLCYALVRVGIVVRTGRRNG